MLEKSKTYPFYVLIGVPKIHTDLLWSLSLLILGLCVLYFGAIFLFRKKIAIKSKEIRAKKKELSPMISEFLFFEENAEKEEKKNYINLRIEIRELLNNPQNRKILIDVLMDLRKDLSGNTLQKLFELFKSLGLQNDSYNKLESWRWQKVSKGIHELTQMHVEESFSIISKLINNRNATIRKQAEIAIVTLKHQGINYFLNSTTYKISEWQQLKIIEVLKDKKDLLPPRFKHWLVSKNKDVVLFAIRLMKYYNQSDGNISLIELLKHKNEEIKTEAIDCIKEFNVVDALSTLKLVFWNSSVDNKINILDAIATLGSSQDFTFLNSVVAKESNFNVKSKAIATINEIAPMTILPTVGVQNVAKFKKPKDNFDFPPIKELAAEKKEEFSNVTQKETIELQKEEVIENAEVDTQNLEKSKPEKPNSEVLQIISELETTSKTDLSMRFPEKSVHNSKTKYHPKNEGIISSKDFKELKVNYDIVGHSLPSKIEKEQPEKVSKLGLDNLIIDYIPIVVPSNFEIDFNQVFSNNQILKCTVIDSEEIKNNIEPLKNKFLSELKAIVPLSKTTTTNSKKIEDSYTIDSLKSICNIDMKKVKEIDCEAFEIVPGTNTFRPVVLAKNDSKGQINNIQENENSIVDALEWIRSLNEAEEELKQKIKTIITNQERSSLVIPKSIIYTTYEANTIALLDDIEILGDKRELFLLQDLLLDKKNDFVRERILILIDKISDTDVLRNFSSEPNYNRSVFRNFFKKADSASKLILLDEIVAIGDEKEIGFLKQLSETAIPTVKKKAINCLEDLKAKLLQEKKSEQLLSNKTEKEPCQVDNLIKKEGPIPFDVFEIDFEMAPSININQD